jgi:uncharacterized protein YbcI
MLDAQPEEPRGGGVLAAVSNAMVALHKEQFGRGPTKARSNFAGSDTLVCVLENALHAAENAMVEMGQQQRVSETRLFLQDATRDRFISVIEEIVQRKVRAFTSGTDPRVGIVYEIFTFEPRASGSDGNGTVTADS